jgi:hypothetical protein
MSEQAAHEAPCWGSGGRPPGKHRLNTIQEAGR